MYIVLHKSNALSYACLPPPHTRTDVLEVAYTHAGGAESVDTWPTRGGCWAAHLVQRGRARQVDVVVVPGTRVAWLTEPGA